MPPADPGQDRHAREVELALQRIREAKRRQEVCGLRLGASTFTLVWQGLALFLLGLMVGVGLHVFVMFLFAE